MINYLKKLKKLNLILLYFWFLLDEKNFFLFDKICELYKKYENIQKKQRELRLLRNT
jgi:hypothetical protein